MTGESVFLKDVVPDRSILLRCKAPDPEVPIGVDELLNLKNKENIKLDGTGSWE